MPAFIVSFLVGVVCILLGIGNAKGNLSSLHSYHTRRVAEEDRLPMGRLVGFGTILIGASIVVFSVLSIVTLLTDQQIFLVIGGVVMALGTVVGIALTLYGIQKYNKGIF